ncbi:MAG: hypothetical protein IKG47_00435 [Oscillospiraceae bacterium]|nr:hypothetical protein [Clostridiales bacterium]MBR3353812.1 hypothetical protein [Oscillospiraceae bacterium]
MESLGQIVTGIIENSDFNSLPIEERGRIRRYTREQQILTLYQVLIKDKDLTTVAWRKKIRSWLENCIDTYQREEI